MARTQPRCDETNMQNDYEFLCQNLESHTNKMKKRLVVFLLFSAGALILITEFRNSLMSRTMVRLNNDNDNMIFTCKLIFKALIDIREDFSLINQKVKTLSNKVEGLVNQQMGGNELNDYALKAAGACILKVYNTKTYKLEKNSCSPLGNSAKVEKPNPVDTILQASIYPGDCWAMTGSKGNVVIKLSTSILVENVTLEHIHKSNAPLGDTTSAPNKFSIWGLKCEKCESRHLFGSFHYDNDGPAMQTFPVEYTSMQPFRIIEFEIHTNNGNPKFTCIYRLRIHGRKPSTI